jgi:hypothetical protein
VEVPLFVSSFISKTWPPKGSGKSKGSRLNES